MRSAFSLDGRTRRSTSAEYLGKPYQDTANAPTTRYSTLLELKHSINSFKSFCKRIGMGALTQLEKDLDALFGSHSRALLALVCISRLKRFEDADCFLHCPSLSPNVALRSVK